MRCNRTQSCAHLSHSMPPLLSMRVCSSPSSRFCLLLLLFWPSHAVKLRRGGGQGGADCGMCQHCSCQNTVPPGAT